MLVRKSTIAGTGNAGLHIRIGLASEKEEVYNSTKRSDRPWTGAPTHTHTSLQKPPCPAFRTKSSCCLVSTYTALILPPALADRSFERYSSSTNLAFRTTASKVRTPQYLISILMMSFLSVSTGSRRERVCHCHLSRPNHLGSNSSTNLSILTTALALEELGYTIRQHYRSESASTYRHAHQRTMSSCSKTTYDTTPFNRSAKNKKKCTKPEMVSSNTSNTSNNK